MSGSTTSSSPTTPSRLRRAACAFALSCLTASALQAQEAGAGRIKMASGSAFIIRQQASIPAKVGVVVFESDLLRTGTDGRIGMTLKDDTRVSLGPQTEVRISRLAYAPAEGRFALVLSIARGVVAYVSGHIARLSADSVRVQTPNAVIGVRGTRLAIYVPDR